MATTTKDRYEGVLKNYLLPQFGEDSLAELTPRRLQEYFLSLCRSELSHESVDKTADVAMYKAKKNGGGRYCFFRGLNQSEVRTRA
jgi:Phage integrase, N-terminal SAM-like domain